MGRNPKFAIVVLVGLALYAGFTVFARLHDGRSRFGGGMGRFRGGLDCSYAPRTFPARP